MNCIDFCVILKYCVKQLMIFGRTVVAASDLKNCTMVNCEYDMWWFKFFTCQNEVHAFSILPCGIKILSKD